SSKSEAGEKLVADLDRRRPWDEAVLISGFPGSPPALTRLYIQLQENTNSPMPPPATPHRPSNRGGSAKSSPTKTKALDIGVPLGIYDTNSVRAKIRKWQQQGGGVITADDVVYYEDEEENLTTTTATDSNTDAKFNTVKEKSSTISTVNRKRSKSTPRKRLVSDEHWKLNRTPTKSPALKFPQPKRISEYTTNESVLSQRTVVDETKKVDKPRPPPSSDSSVKEWRRSRPPRDADSLVGSRISEEDGMRNGSSKSSSRPGSADKPLMAARSEPSEGPRKKDQTNEEDSEWAASDADFSELSRRRARGPNPAPKTRGSLKPPKGGIFEHMLGESKKVFTKPEAPKPVATRGSKIEAWLTGTSDPFFDSIVDPEVEVPAPLKMRSNRGKVSPKRDERDHANDPETDGSTRRKSVNKSRVRSREESHGERTKTPSHKSDSREARRDTSSSSSKKRSSEHRHNRSSSSFKEEAARGKPHSDKDGMSDIETYILSEGSEVSASNAPVHISRKRPFPSTGFHRLSTIASMESMSIGGDARSLVPTSDTQPTSAPTKDEPEERDQFDPDSLPVISSQLKRRLTTHDDLISVLSAPHSRSRSIRSARSIRTNKSRLLNATVNDILKELSADEDKYMRELRTLVGGVIPVLLTCVLSKSNSAIAAGLFRPSTDPKDEVNFSKPIVDMGVAIERLKTLHRRIPQDNAEALLTWAFGAQRVYRDYLKAWRLGFKDVIVNLAPLEENERADDAETRSLDEGMARDENGDVVNSDGEKVDVAYLLKRPLVRLKYLAKTFKGINMLEPSEKAGEVATSYQDLVTDARRRARDERARLEDESAASIDSTRARNPATLEPLLDIGVSRKRRVRARDFFNLSLYHSTGQVIDCRAELLLRDNSSGNGSGGDLLICEIDQSDRWLLFPPMDLTCVSARNGDTKGEIVVMLRSSAGQTKAWQELLLLKIDEEDIGFEWVQMLGLTPVPPTICRSQSFIDRAKQRQRARTITSSEDPSTLRMPSSPTNVDVPLGERATSRPLRRSSPKEQLSDPSTVGSSLVTASRGSTHTEITREADYTAAEPETPVKSRTQTQPSILHSRNPRKSLTDIDMSPGLKRSKAKRVVRHEDEAPPTPVDPKEQSPSKGHSAPATPRRDHEEHKLVASPLDKPQVKCNYQEQRQQQQQQQQMPKTPTRDTPEQSSPRVSSVPSANLPVIPRLRQRDIKTYESLPPMSDESDEDEYMHMAASSTLSESPTKKKRHSRSNSDSSDQADGEEPPPPPPHSRSPSSTGSSLTNTPVLSPNGQRIRRRGSSPLKHEYEPSTASDSYSDSEASTVRRYDMYSESDYSDSESSDESEDELPSVVTPIKPHELPRSIAHDSVLTSATSSLSPSNSASQGGYRSVPSQPTKATTAMASVFAWSDKGSWDSIYPDDCRIIVGPGLIEAFEISAVQIGADGIPSRKGRPLIALELTPLVPIRRGTAIDISIRSPPTDRSKIMWSNNIMFRSANPDECEALYTLINQARINNPTYIALQNARGPFAEQPTIPMDREEKSGGWFGWPRRRKSYRASASPRSLADNSESSVGTMSSAFSALKRFGAGSKMFSISRSSVSSRSRQKEESLYSAASGSNFTPNSGIGRIAAAIKNADGIGLSNAKIRLYVRETQSKWRDMGAARLTIMPATPAPSPSRPGTAVSGRSDPSSGAEGADESPPASGAASPRRAMDSTKRILIRGKTRNEVLLDVCLGESAFERIARTGIAISVWEENAGGAMPKKGGVTNGSSRVYMIQMKSEAEAAYTFGLVGKLRY
ncbi:lumenal Hsp70 protein, partial [Aspergillus nanangensis]